MTERWSQSCQELDYNVIILQDLPRSQHPSDSDPWQFLSAGQDASVSERLSLGGRDAAREISSYLDLSLLSQVIT